MPEESDQPVKAVVVRENTATVRAEDFLPVLSVEQAVARKEQINAFINKVLVETKPAKGEEPRVDGDYGRIPGAGDKKVLLKPGAEKLCSIFGLAPRYVPETVIEDWTGEQHGGEPLFYYALKCQLYRGDRFMGEAIGSANSRESKHRYRWVPEEIAKLRPDFDSLPKRGGTRTMFEPLFALEAKRTDGQYGKPAEYWESFQSAINDKTARYIEQKQLGKKKFDGWEMTVNTTVYRIPNPDCGDVINTLQKMAQKRALVAAVLVVTNCSDAFTQDLEDQIEPEAVETHEQLTERRIAEEKAKAAKAEEVPAELRELFDRITKEPAGSAFFQQTQDLFYNNLVDAGGADGKAVADRILADMAKMAEGRKATRADLKTCLLKLWTATQEFKARPTYKGADEDVPF